MSIGLVGRDIGDILDVYWKQCVLVVAIPVVLRSSRSDRGSLCEMSLIVMNIMPLEGRFVDYLIDHIILLLCLGIHLAQLIHFYKINASLSI